MLFNLSSFSLFALAVSSAVYSRPVANPNYGVPAPFTPRASFPVTLGGVPIGFNQRGGNFDDFFGAGNFAGNFNQVTIVKQQKQLVCSSNDLRRVRQQLAVIQEFAKQIILQQICEVEIQTVIIQQFNAQFGNFGSNVRRSNGRNVAPSFDLVVAQKITQITQVINRGGSLLNLDLGFTGKDIGRNSVRVGGSNWKDATSPGSVGKAYKVAQGQQGNNNSKERSGQNTTLAATATATAVASSTSAAEATATSAATSATGSGASAAPAPTQRQ